MRQSKVSMIHNILYVSLYNKLDYCESPFHIENLIVGLSGCFFIIMKITELRTSNYGSKSKGFPGESKMGGGKSTMAGGFNRKSKMRLNL